ncbi:DUF1345 domain-containing protein [Mycolicibacterium sp.]|uniref:DUF1345 domain-containing protein n=1 Tax=Mycolicibacterium sp. TaxID=2320850 RepID=UPI0028A6C5A0|nr:DUF1345 domain-containing protein [Mycolicibacterium sp.]
MVRISVALALGVVAGISVGVLRGEWHYSFAIGWIVAAGVYLVWTWMLLFGLDADQTAEHVRKRREDGTPLVSHVVVLLASGAGLAGVGYLLAATDDGQRRIGEALIGILSVIASWFAIHTTFTLRYATLFYTEPRHDPDADPVSRAIDYHQSRQPCYKDFAYLAFTVGMTYQVSDTDLGSARIRGSVLGHALVSFLLGAVVLASTINLVLALAGH